jgi:predicted Zn-dependent peptidase
MKTILNRTIQPELQPIENLKLLAHEKRNLQNGLPVLWVAAGEQEVSKIDFTFKAGSWYQLKPFVATTTAQLLKEGTTDKTATEIAEIIDYHGASLSVDSSEDQVTLSLVTLNKYLEVMLMLVAELIEKPVFPERELVTFLDNQRQQLFINEQKVSYLARTRFKNRIFGNTHPYGIFLTQQHLDEIVREDLVQHHQQHFQPDHIVASGKLPENLFSLLERLFGQRSFEEKPAANFQYDIPELSERKFRIEKTGALQCAIMMGKPLFNRTHPDYYTAQVANTLFGGYFGSRLMKNIREDKGFTYGIYSHISSLQNAGYFYIFAETGKDITDAALKEIYHEMDNLHQNLVAEEELEVVKNYLLGQFMRMVDGPFETADYLKLLCDYGLDEDYFYQYLNTVQNVDAAQIRTVFNTYFKPETMIELVAG